MKQILKEWKQFLNEEEEYYHISDATYDDGSLAEDVEFWDDVIEEAEYQGRKVTLNNRCVVMSRSLKYMLKTPKPETLRK
mgnify:CR=1 FL=1